MSRPQRLVLTLFGWLLERQPFRRAGGRSALRRGGVAARRRRAAAQAHAEAEQRAKDIDLRTLPSQRAGIPIIDRERGTEASDHPGT